MDEIVMGATYHDVVTGFRGVAIGHCIYISGCNQTLISPRVDEKGTFQEARWIDDQRMLRDTSAGVVKVDNSKTPGFDKPAPLK